MDIVGIIFIVLLILFVLDLLILIIRYSKFRSNKRVLKVGRYKIYSDRNK